ncbi:TIGR02679 family protein [Gordonia sp. HY002]|uniref:TIGR02679 family protein n=1 Tax=Gordonia zhenghanii TaxID=2911516 RepID=UPI001EF07EE7|nr:TIGR02679 family protein [Gordonia zhenghanii]MCF8571239.1 TIGR02679 family protein [Gordonia zhenghanii]MCF8601763.1 TIGR02679 family protein [Gordonia zhenghanii]
MTGDRRALDRLIGGPETAWLVERVRGRILAAGERPLDGTVVLADPTAEQRTAVARLVGRPRRSGRTLRVDLAAVEEILRRGPWPAGLADAVETISGSVVDRAAIRSRDAQAWAAVRDRMAPALAKNPEVGDWWETWCATGNLKRAARSENRRTGSTDAYASGALLVDAVVRVLDVLPASGEPLAVIARRAVGDAHGLDATRPLGRFAVAAVGAVFGGDADRSAREVWAAAGVVQSALASTVLCLGVSGAPRPATGVAASTAASLTAMKSARTATVLTLEQIRSGGIAVAAPDDVVHVCENPAVVEVVADVWRLRATGTDPLLVCTSGQPSAAVVDLLTTLATSGAQVRYHGDFDWAGLHIARAVYAKVAWEPWRFGAGDYRAAVEADDRRVLRLSGALVESPWDPELASAMAENGLAVEEEAVIGDLVADVLGTA